MARQAIPTICGCDLPRKGHGLCQLHYEVAHYHQLAPDAPIRGLSARRIHDPELICGCDEPYHSQGFCRFHYDAIQRHERHPDKAIFGLRIANPTNTTCGCDAPHSADGLCDRHYWHHKVLLKDPDATLPGLMEEPTTYTCECDLPPAILGLCSLHANQLRNLQMRPDSTLYLPQCITRAIGTGDRGYRRIGAKFEHRMVMEEMQGRPLYRHENVHHKNTIRDDNRPENLELWSTSQPSGGRVSDKIEWAIWFLSQYGYTVQRRVIDLSAVFRRNREGEAA